MRTYLLRVAPYNHFGDDPEDMLRLVAQSKANAQTFDNFRRMLTKDVFFADILTKPSDAIQLLGFAGGSRRRRSRRRRLRTSKRSRSTRNRNRLS